MSYVKFNLHIPHKGTVQTMIPKHFCTAFIACTFPQCLERKCTVLEIVSSPGILCSENRTLGVL